MRFLTFLWCLVAAVALAGDDPRGWSEGTVAAGTARVISDVEGAPTIELPKQVIKALGARGMLLYFSPSCPHCRAVASELDDLGARIAKKGTLVWVASSRATDAEIAEFRKTYGIRGEILHDSSGEIVAAMGARSTPAGLWVEPIEGPKVLVKDVWYPYIHGLDALVEARAFGDPWAGFRKGEYHGTDVCASCHEQEGRSWTLTHHAVAWRTLVLADEHENAECTGCHVVGQGKPGGFDGPESHLVDVGCESCHGPGGPHAPGGGADANASCATCHDEKHSLSFTYDKGLPLIDHFKAAAMDEETWRAAAMELYAGNVPRQLASFDGENLGNAACTGCHTEETASWAASRHGSSMMTLTVAGKGDAGECVACHATPKVSGLNTDRAVGDYHVGDSVGCESCHGPGEAHVAAGGGTGNIERLGDDCPVCVIEAVCTSCHDTENDPGWDLDKKLPLVGHTAP